MLYDITQFGARGDGNGLEHQAIQAAIDKCSSDGGGTVHIPAGRYCCGTIHLRSNVTIHLEMGAIIVGADTPELFPEICKTPYGNLPGQIQAVLWGEKVENVRIEGPGAIDGGKNMPLAGDDSVQVRFRPALVFFRDCRNLQFSDCTLRYSSFWTLHLLRCNDVSIRGITILAHRDRINTDGIDPDGCRNVVISDCKIATGDDCIVIKSTEGDVCENIVVSNCIVSTRCAALKIGTEAIGNIRNVSMNNCIIRDTAVALSLYMKDGSTYENISFTNMIIEAYNDFPLLVDNTPRYHNEPRYGTIRNITFENVTITSRGRMLIEGLPDRPVQNLTIRNLTWNVVGSIKFEESYKPGGARRISPDPTAINYAQEPYQILAINAEDFTMQNIRIYDRRDTPVADRGFLFAKSVRGGSVEDVVCFPGPDGISSTELQDCRDMQIVRVKAGDNSCVPSAQ